MTFTIIISFVAMIYDYLHFLKADLEVRYLCVDICEKAPITGILTLAGRLSILEPQSLPVVSSTASA